ncbi:MAG TPA: ATP-binding protein [Steroidobacteraceae bacterium]|nr:ATP-binding protein [Steroidobacteraceae bacterium]
MSLRFKLLLLGLATLVLPWAGCRYAREMESALREGEQNALASVAQTIASSLQGRRDLLYREADGSDSPEATPYDLQPILLSTPPFLDGYPDEWPQDRVAWRYFARGAHRFGILTGVSEHMLYALLDVHDTRLVFDAPGANPLDAASIGDRVWLAFDDPDGDQHQVFLGASGPGTLMARRIESGEYGQQTAVDEPRVSGAWQPSPQGYRVEVRLPLSMVGEHFGVLIDDRDERGAVPVSYGTLRSDNLHTVGRLMAASPDLDGYLQQFLQPGLRIRVTSTSGGLLAQADALAQSTGLGPPPPLLARLYRRFVDRPGGRRIIDSTAPVHGEDSHAVIGTLEVSQTEDRWLTLRDRALTRMLNFTLITSLIAVISMFIFAARLAMRLARFRRASESALRRDGLVTDFPETDAADELGDVARGFSTLLKRVNEYTGYLRTLAGKLAHEIRTPLTIVRSSLENMESEKLSPNQEVYLQRARQGSERLNAILVAMGAASRVEEAISHAERARFDLVAVIVGAVDSYRVAFPSRRFATETPPEPLQMEGAPDLIVQMLDKLVDNAVDFSADGATITVRLLHDPDPTRAVLEVDNPGPPIPAETGGQLFESLWQSRSGSDTRPHFGLGLYIVRLIAEFHGGSAAAESLPGDRGARFRVRLSLAAPGARPSSVS